MVCEHLLAPSIMTFVYYYPFGTTNNISIGENYPWGQTPHHALFHFDQEPIYDTSLGKLYDDFLGAWGTKYCKLLANSEKSQIKKTLCQERSMLDWYYFYHGFAALDWFRDAQYLFNVANPQKVFCSLNHLVTGKRSYRISLTSRLMQNQLAPYGDISFHGTIGQCTAEIESCTTEMSQSDKAVARQMLDSGIFQPPLYVDHASINSSYSARLGFNEYRLWQNAFCHLVNETVYYDEKLHLTEKTFKPIVSLRPFILAASPGSLEYLRQYGFETFGNWIDESYDLEPCHARRQDMIVAEIRKLCALGQSGILDMLADMRPVLEHNKTHFFNNFRKIITEELVENFDHCINIWNNGRVDDRQRPRLRNKKEIVAILLR